jgi:hypothetical protein
MSRVLERLINDMKRATVKIETMTNELKESKEINNKIVVELKRAQKLIGRLTSAFKESKEATAGELKLEKDKNARLRDELKEAKSMISDLRCELIYKKDDESILTDPTHLLLKLCRSTYIDIHRLKDEQIHLELPSRIVALEREMRQMKQIAESPNTQWDKTWNNSAYMKMYNERDGLVHKLSQFVVKRKLKVLKEEEREMAPNWDKIIAQDFEGAKKLLIQYPAEKVNQLWAKFYEKRMLKHKTKIEIYDLESSIVGLKIDEKTDQLVYEMKKQEWQNKMKEFAALMTSSLSVYSPSLELQKLLPSAELELELLDDDGAAVDESKESR